MICEGSAVVSCSSSMEVPYVPSIAAEHLNLGDRIGTGANGAVFAAELRGVHGVVRVCAKVGRPRARRVAGMWLWLAYYSFCFVHFALFVGPRS